MKKFFSAILLMTMMVFSVGTFVSCNDLVEEVETIKGQTSSIESTIKGLETQIAALETALSNAQSTADAALKAGNEAKAAAEQAKADAIAEAKAEMEVLKAAFEQALADKADTKALEDLTALVNAEIAGIDETLAQMDTKIDDAVKDLVAKNEALKVQIAALEAYKAYADTAFVTVEAAQKEAQAIREDLTKLADEYYSQLYELIGGNTSVIATLVDEVDVLKLGLAGYMETTDANIDEITGYLNSAIEDIDLLKGDVKALQEGLKAVEEKVATLEEKVEKIDSSLKTYKTVLEGLVNRIQDVTFVPVWNGHIWEDLITVDKYTYGTDFTTFRFLATYEISPKSLVSKLTNESVNVYFTNLLATKAEPSTYAAEIVSTDPSTGRVVVRGKVTDKKSEVFKLFNAKDSKVEGVAVALHIEENVPGTIDETNVNAGTSVSSDYAELWANVVPHDIATLFRLFDTEKDNKKPQANAYTKTIPVPYTTSPANSTRALFPIDVRMEIEGGYMSLAQASAYFGVPFNVTYGITNNPTYSPNDNATKALFTVTNPKATTATVAFAKAATSNDLDKSVTVVVNDIRINNVPLTGYSFTSTYKVDYGTTSDIQFAAHAANWDYRFYVPDYANDWNGTTMANLYSDYSPAFAYPEINVVSSPIDITKVRFEDAQTYGFTFESGDIKAYNANGQEIKDLLDGTENLTLQSITSKIAKLMYVNLPFSEEVVTFKARKVVKNIDNNMAYTVAFDLTLGARPADKEIPLGTFNVPGSQSHATHIPVTPIAKAIATDAAAFANLPALNVQVPATALVWNQWNYVENKNTNGISLNDVCFDLNGNYPPAYEEKAYISVAQNNNYAASYDLKQTYEFYGIKYTFTAKVNYQAPAYKLVPNPKFVKNNVVDLTGNVTYPSYAKSTGYVDPMDYTLDKINLREYVNVEGESLQDKLNNELKISYTVNKTVPGSYGQFVAPAGVSVANSLDVTVNAYYDYNDNYVETLPENVLEWIDTPQYAYNPYSNLNEVEVEFQLLSKDEKVKFGEPLVIKLIVPELLTFEATKTLSEPFMNNDELTVTNIYKALKITDTKNKTQINNPNATSKSDFFDYIYTEKPNTVTKSGARNVYGITVVPDASKVKIYLKSGAPLTAHDYIFDPETGNVQLANNTGNITENVIIEIPVAMYHMYQGAHPHNAVVKVEFTK